MARLTLEELQRRERRQTQLLEAGREPLVDAMTSRVDLSEARKGVEAAETRIPKIEAELVAAGVE